MRLSRAIVWISCCHCQVITASSGQATSRPTKRGLAARGESGVARAACWSIHQKRGSRAAAPAAIRSLSTRLLCSAAKLSWAPLLALIGTWITSKEQTSAGRCQSRIAGPRAPIAQASKRSSPGRGPGSAPASTNTNPKSSSGTAPRATSWSQSRGSLRGFTEVRW